MALAIVPAAAGTTAALFLGEPAFQVSQSLADRFLKDHPTAKSWARTMLEGGSIGFGAATLVATLSPSVALLPAMGFGALAGAIARTAGRLAKNAFGAMHRFAEARFGWYRSLTSMVKSLVAKIPSWITGPVRWIGRFVRNQVLGAGKYARILHIRDTLKSIAPRWVPKWVLTAQSVGLRFLNDHIVAPVVFGVEPFVIALRPPKAPSLALLGVTATADYIRRAGVDHLFEIFRGEKVFHILTRNQLSVMWTFSFAALIGSVAGSFLGGIRELVSAYRLDKAHDAAVAEDRIHTPRPPRPRPTHLTVVVPTADIVTPDDTPSDAVAEPASATDAEEVAAPDESVAEQSVALDAEAMKRIEEHVEQATAEEFIPPATPHAAEKGPKVVPMGGEDLYTKALEKGGIPDPAAAAKATQAVRDAAALAEGKPLPQRGGGRRPRKATEHMPTSPDEVKLTTTTPIKPAQPARKTPAKEDPAK